MAIVLMDLSFMGFHLVYNENRISTRWPFPAQWDKNRQFWMAVS